MNKISTIDILGVRISVLTKKQLNVLIMNHAKRGIGKPLVIFKPYVEFLSIASKNENIRKLLNKSDINAADSVSLQWAASYLYGKPDISSGFFHAYYSLFVRLQNQRWLNQVLPERMAGVDQSLPLFEIANKAKLRIGIIGGPEDTQSTLNEMSKRFKNISFFVWSGYFEPYEEHSLIKEIAREKLDILFCAMGFPRQEKFIINNKNSLNAKVIIGEGGSFDYDQLGGKIKRAPKWIRNIGFEWMWRLILQPKRLGRQMAIPVFINKVRKQKSEQK